MKFFLAIVSLLLLLFGKGSSQTDPIDVAIEAYVRDKFDGFRAWFLDLGHTAREHDLPEPRVVNVSAEFAEIYHLTSLLSDAKFYIYFPDLSTLSITSNFSGGGIMIKLDPPSDPSLIGTHSTTGSEMGNPLNGTGLFAHTYADFNVHLDVEYQLIDGYLRCNSTPNPGYSSAVRSLTTLENLLPTNHPRYVEIMANYGTQIWISYALDIVQLPGMLATQQFLCEKLAETTFVDIISPLTPPPLTTTMSTGSTTTTIPTATSTSSLAPISTTDGPTTTNVTHSSTTQETTTFTASTSIQGTGAGVRWEGISTFLLSLTLCIIYSTCINKFA